MKYDSSLFNLHFEGQKVGDLEGLEHKEQVNFYIHFTNFGKINFIILTWPDDVKQLKGSKLR